jgi:hypothetical protein
MQQSQNKSQSRWAVDKASRQQFKGSRLALVLHTRRRRPPSRKPR